MSSLYEDLALYVCLILPLRSLYLVPQCLLPRTYDGVDPYRLVCVPTIAGLRLLVYFFARASASAGPSSRLEWPTSSWTGLGTILSSGRLEWELSSLPNDWNCTGNRPMLGVDSYPRLYI